MSDEELKRFIEDVSIEVFDKPFLHDARFNGRLRTTGGRYMLTNHSIQINPLVMELHDMEELRGIVKHELCHYHLHIEGKGYQHRDADFRELLKQTKSPRFCKPLAERPKKMISLHIYKCMACGLEYKRKRRMDIRKYRCGKCAGEIAET